MSADNGIYILETNHKEGGHEYRVAHQQAIDNLSWSEETASDTEDENIHIKNARGMFSDSPVFIDGSLAWEFANNLSKEYEILEYGIQQIKINRIF